MYDISNRNYGSFFGHGINKARDVIEHAETAFDKEKVIEDLQEAGQSCNEANDICGAEAIEYAIEIVEKGGIE